MPFLEGYIAGLALIVLIGPVLFVLLSATLERGRASGFAVAVGIFVSDILAASITALGFARLLTASSVAQWIGLAGGGVLLSLGLRYLLAKPPSERPSSKPSAGSLFGFFSRGFLVNFVNPFVFMVWLGIVAAAGNRHGTGGGLALFLVGCVLGIFTLDTAKVLLAGQLKTILNPTVLKWAFRGSGTLMCLFGGRLIALQVL